MNHQSYPGSELDLFRHAVNWKKYFSVHISPYISGQVLEVGAGIGGTTAFLVENEHDSWTCLEPDPSLVVQLTEFIKEKKPDRNYSVVTGNINDLNRGTNYDTILYIDVLEHILDDRAELSRAARLLAPDGCLIVLSPAYQWLYSEFDKAIGHYRRYTRTSLVNVAPGNLKLINIKYLDSMGVFASLVNRLFLHKKNPDSNQVLLWDRKILPLSKTIDPIIRYSFGKTILAIWKNTA